MSYKLIIVHENCLEVSDEATVIYKPSTSDGCRELLEENYNESLMRSGSEGE